MYTLSFIAVKAIIYYKQFKRDTFFTKNHNPKIDVIKTLKDTEQA